MLASQVRCVAIIILQLMVLVSATSRAFVPHHDADKKSPMFLSHSVNTQSIGREMVDEEAYTKRSVIGSRLSNYEHKCGGCFQAIQVPTSNDHVKVQCANYEPQGWKCNCGTRFFSP